ncbi:GNAT family N-acetyltransferase [Oscillatoria amoena NRMC-F 0135]|nr:GNAT family N-acetyltransferase [Oscillatoria amoena NRMC-F 0135]
MSKPINIRNGNRRDLPRVLELIKELAEYERAPHEVINTVELMEQDGFGPNPIYGLFVAENEHGVVGTSIFYWRYSTWKGKRLYLEDIVVTERERGKGTGKLLFDRTLQQALDENCSGMMWQVLEWNEPAINFYKKFYNPKLDVEWINCSLEREQIEAILKKILNVNIKQWT